jgi:hypothetical protein
MLELFMFMLLLLWMVAIIYLLAIWEDHKDG